MKIISGSSNISFAKNLAKELKLKLVDVDISKFANGETRLIINDTKQTLKGDGVVIVQSFVKPIDNRVI